VDVFSRWESPDQPAVEEIGPQARTIRVQVGPPRYIPKEETILFLPELAEWIDRFQEQHQADYRLIHGHYYFSGAVALILHKQWRVPFVETFHSLGIVKRKALGQQDLSPNRRFEIEQQITEEAARIIATAPQEKDDLTAVYGAEPSRIQVVPCGVNLDLFRPEPREDARRYTGVPTDRFLLTFVGRLERRKGIDTLLEAMGKLLAEQPDLPLHAIIVGGQPKGEGAQAEMSAQEAAEHHRHKEILNRLGIAERVTFTGGLPQHLLYHYYSAGDVTIIPSYYEPFGMTALEALACGSSVIASRVGGLKTTVVDGEVGLQFEPRNVKDLADKITRLIEHPDTNAHLQQNARPYVERTYSWPSIAERTAAIYRAVLAGFNEE
jgi:D-inositol-3-phosphate glycosyltransferase